MLPPIRPPLLILLSLFLPTQPFYLFLPNSPLTSPSSLSSKPNRSLDPAFQKRVLTNTGDIFTLSPTGAIEFGNTLSLSTPLLSSPDPSLLNSFISDPARVMASLWDPKLKTELSPTSFTLKLLSIDFISFSLAPSVTVAVSTSTTSSGATIFRMHSTSFEPNISLLPNLKITADQLNLAIDLVGQLRVARDGKSIVGGMGYVVSGTLIGPTKFIPKTLLSSASSAINKRTTTDARSSFESGVRKQLAIFKKEELDSLLN